MPPSTVFERKLRCSIHVFGVADFLERVHWDMRATFEPSPAAVALQAQIDAATLRGAPAVVGVGPGDLYFGTRSLIIHRASNLTLRSSAGPGAARLWFGIGAGILVNQSADVVLDGLDVDYDPPAHWQGTVVQVIDDRSSADIKAFVVTDPGFLDPATFDALYRKGTPGVQSSPVALVWNASDPEFGAYAPASWPPLPAPTAFQNVFTVPRASICTDINAVTTDGSSCLDGHAVALRAHDKVTAHIRTLHSAHAEQQPRADAALRNPRRPRLRHHRVRRPRRPLLLQCLGWPASRRQQRRHVRTVQPHWWQAVPGPCRIQQRRPTFCRVPARPFIRGRRAFLLPRRFCQHP